MFNRVYGSTVSFFRSFAYFRRDGYSPPLEEDDNLSSNSQSQMPAALEYYKDDFNDESWSCNFGTRESDGIWMNRDDPPGTILSMTVAVLIGKGSLISNFHSIKCFVKTLRSSS